MDYVGPVRAAGRMLWPPAWKWLQRRMADKQALVREGSTVVTPVIEFAEQAGPVGVSFGEQTQIQERVREWTERWEALRPPLLT